MSRPKKNKTTPKLHLASEESKRVIAAFKASLSPSHTMTTIKPLQSPPRVLTGVSDGLHPTPNANYFRKV